MTVFCIVLVLALVAASKVLILAGPRLCSVWSSDKVAVEPNRRTMHDTRIRVSCQSAV